jgi:hypothetical protein
MTTPKAEEEDLVTGYRSAAEECQQQAARSAPGYSGTTGSRLPVNGSRLPRKPRAPASKDGQALPRFTPTAGYFSDMAALYREIARRMSDPHAADRMSAIAARHQERANELEGSRRVSPVLAENVPARTITQNATTSLSDQSQEGHSNVRICWPGV